MTEKSIEVLAIFFMTMFRRNLLTAACSLDEQLKEDGTNKDQRVNRIMEWKQFRPSILSTLWNSMYFGFLISLLSAVLIGTFSTALRGL